MIPDRIQIEFGDITKLEVDTIVNAANTSLLGGGLHAKYIIHTPGPKWREGRVNEDVLLANCYKNSLKLAVENNIKTIAFPAISTGVYCFPVKRATNIALNEAINFLAKNEKIEKIIFICYDITTFDVYKRLTGGYP